MRFSTQFERPRGDRHIAFPVPAFVASAAYVIETPKKVVDKTPAHEVSFARYVVNSDDSRVGQIKETVMNLTKIGTSKNGKKTSYAGAARKLTFANAAFVNSTAPDAFDVADGVFAPAVVKTPKVKMTAEERKAARANKPKLTLAEKIAKREEQIAKMKAKLTSDNASL